MSQIMRLRRVAGNDFGIEDRNNGFRHEHAFVTNIERNGLLHEADLLPDSYGGKFNPRAVPELVGSLPAITKALMRRKVTPAKALLHQHKAPEGVKEDLRDGRGARGARRAQPLHQRARRGLEDNVAEPPAGEAHATPTPSGPGATTAQGVAPPEPEAAAESPTNAR